MSGFEACHLHALRTKLSLELLYLNFYMPQNLLVLYLLTWLLGPQNTAATIKPTYIYHNCTNTTTFTPNSIYHSNLKQLLSSLSSNSTSHEFYNATAGQDPTTSVYGNFLCGGDVNATTCRDCVLYATEDVVKRCPIEKQSMIWYDECQLRYSNRSFFGTMDERPRITLVDTTNITSDLEPLREKLNFTIKEAAAEAANGGGKRYATKEANFSGFQTVYTSVQCTPDLYIFDCMKCISDAFERAVLRFSDKHSVRTLLPSCNLRFALYPFYNQIASPLSPLTASPTSPASLSRPKVKSKISTRTLVPIVVSILVLLILGGYFPVKRGISKYNAENPENAENDITTIDSLQFDLATIEAATSKFSIDNKLGEGGFGEVYKGMLRNGREIAVKRLSKYSSQGEEEFKNEVVLVAKLQHRNLVRLLGFCVGRSEKLLVYEFVPNKSLDYSLFHREKEVEILDWTKRRKIIGGIARGILYLHEDSRLRVIHRDLKASNVLLDVDMNPKISDFGMARMFGIDQTEGNTRRIAGTYGYMAPEYAMEGLYSIKSDVFSFGVLLLEILCGRRNTGFHYPMDSAPSLVAYAWQLWNAGEVLELMDPLMKDSCPPNELTRYVHIGLLCVQEDANKRPTMSTVVLMLQSESLNLSQPERPAFFVGRFTQQHHETGINNDNCSVNAMTVSDFVPR